jgi:hypothetical protein
MDLGFMDSGFIGVDSGNRRKGRIENNDRDGLSTEGDFGGSRMGSDRP